jgi:hypothetical protein
MGGVNSGVALRRANAIRPNRPSQNEYRKRAVQVRNGECGAECGVVEQQSNEGTKFCRLGCLVSWLFKNFRTKCAGSNLISVIAKHRALSPRVFPNSNGIELFSPALTRQRLRWVNVPNHSSTLKGLDHTVTDLLKPRWGFDFILTFTRRSSFLATPG